MMRTLLAMVTAALVACTGEDVDGGAELDGIDDDVALGGKGDGDAYTADEVIGILRAANISYREDLLEQGLGRLATDHLVAFRLGPDAELLTDDDRRFSTLADLDGVPWVGPNTIRQLLEIGRLARYLPTANERGAWRVSVERLDGGVWATFDATLVPSPTWTESTSYVTGLSSPTMLVKFFEHRSGDETITICLKDFRYDHFDVSGWWATDLCGMIRRQPDGGYCGGADIIRPSGAEWIHTRMAAVRADSAVPFRFCD